MIAPDQLQPGGGQKPLANLPGELLEIVISRLANRDIKSLRLTSKYLRDLVPLRLDRVFLSPNPRNIEVFNAIAQHETYRHQILEIVYDDARFAEAPAGAECATRADKKSDELKRIYSAHAAVWEKLGPEVEERPRGVPPWYFDKYKEIVGKQEQWNSSRERRPDTLAREVWYECRLDAKQSYQEYQKLLRHQEEAMGAGADVSALLYGLTRFPRLRRITLTPVAHGRFARPFFETPMIRGFPFGFIYPIPRGWPPLQDNGYTYIANPWVTASEDEKNKWRGFRVVSRALAHHLAQQQSPSKPSVPEFVVCTNQVQTGINCRVFDEPNNEYNALVTIFRQPGFSRLDLSLLVGGQQHEGWHSFRSNLLRKSLEQAPDLQHISLTTNLDPADFDAPNPEDQLSHFISLSTIFPIEIWSNLHHFGLMRFAVKQSDLLAFLTALPPTLRSVELSYLYFLEVEGAYMEFLVDMRDRLGWRQRPSAERPKIIVNVDSRSGNGGGLVVSVDSEVEDFVYGDGENPFTGLGHYRNEVYHGIGILQDPFEPTYERPNVGVFRMMKLGYTPKEDWAVPLLETLPALRRGFPDV